MVGSHCKCEPTDNGRKEEQRIKKEHPLQLVQVSDLNHVVLAVLFLQPRKDYMVQIMRSEPTWLVVIGYEIDIYKKRKQKNVESSSTNEIRINK